MLHILKLRVSCTCLIIFREGTANARSFSHVVCVCENQSPLANGWVTENEFSHIGCSMLTWLLDPLYSEFVAL